jgi:hypothetical protein
MKMLTIISLVAVIGIVAVTSTEPVPVAVVMSAPGSSAGVHPIVATEGAGAGTSDNETTSAGGSIVPVFVHAPSSGSSPSCDLVSGLGLTNGQKKAMRTAANTVRKSAMAMNDTLTAQQKAVCQAMDFGLTPGQRTWFTSNKQCVKSFINDYSALMDDQIIQLFRYEIKNAH